MGTTATRHPTRPPLFALGHSWGGGQATGDRTGREPELCTRLTQHVHDFFPASLSPGRHGDQDQESAGNRPERAGTEGRRSARLRAQELYPAVPSRPSSARPALPKGVSASELPSPTSSPPLPERKGDGEQLPASWPQGYPRARRLQQARQSEAGALGTAGQHGKRGTSATEPGRERQRGRDRETKRQRLGDRRRDRDSERDTETEMQRQRFRETQRQIQRQRPRERLRDRDLEIDTDRQRRRKRPRLRGRGRRRWWGGETGKKKK